MPGQYYDGESGLFYNRFRYYKPSIGRYVTSDPSGLDVGLNSYSYVAANPLVFFDINGLTKGGKKNIGTEGLNRNSPESDVQERLDDAIENDSGNRKRIKALRALLKVIRRGGTMGIIGGILLDDILRTECGMGDLAACNNLCRFFPEEAECSNICPLTI